MIEEIDHEAEEKFEDFLRRENFPASVSALDISLAEWPAKPCGLYAWLAADGSAYLGQSVNVKSRLNEHIRNHGDLVTYSWKPIAREQLDRAEQILIPKLEQCFSVRNVKFAKDTVTRVPYDLTMSGQVALPDLSQCRIKAQSKFAKFEMEPTAQLITQQMVRFVQNAIPEPWVTEGRFWNASVKPNFIRLNAGQQEVFTCYSEGQDHIEVRLLCPTRLRPLLKMRPMIPWRLYETRSREHYFFDDEFAHFENWQPMRDFVVWLMRHTTPLTSASHVPQVLGDMRLHSSFGKKYDHQPSPLSC